ncbi:hypothetical protein [Oleidesulfovibrio alaskensis]|jgi:hypothetical protein|uniref:hypothetical protein n=1 Tax=Oleidesulfovibrio alaskensis TaxID=58180 RepID=UPI001A42DFF8|nr:hypothetical protein [Oleidesulfovibrio alaskensis]MBG0774156.1 hypothetical protein [Oleidesulfovibrio alaskensis]MBL3582948.1 hypothetical protein [Oleidesulfovibrio alaskensis]
MKYILFEDFSGMPVPFIFPDRVDHADMREQMPYTLVLAAGYVHMRQGQFYCHGGAPELEATARAEDAAIIRDFFLRDEAE